MDVPHSRFPYEALKIVQEVADSHFIAFDLEFSGVAGRRPDKSRKLTLQEYYEDIKEAAEKYQILQVGLTIVREDPKTGRYIARPYNFNISPLTPLHERVFGRTWSYHSGAISFLTRNGFRFDLPITQGIQYLSRKEEQQARATMIEHDELRSKMEDMALKKEDDALISHIRSSVREWLALPKARQEPYLNVPGEGEGIPSILNNYQMRLTHQIVRQEYPQLKTVGMKYFVQITNPNEEQQASERLGKAQERERRLADAVGFRWLMEAIFAGNISGMPDSYVGHGLPSDLNGLTPKDFIHQLQEKLRTRRRVVIGHNCFTDLVNLYKCFIGDLPSTVQAFASDIHSLLPGVMDTKYVASDGNKRWGDTSLEGVERSLMSERLPRIDIPAEFDRYQHASSYHEAGYDSLLTARIAIKLSAKMEREGQYLELDRKKGSSDECDHVAFGAEDEGYVTAAESIHSQVSQESVPVSSTTKAAVSGLEKVRAFFGREDPASSQNAVQVEVAGGAASTLAKGKTESVVAVKEREHAAKWMNKNEVAKIKKTLANTNIYESLEMDQSGPELDSSDELTSATSGSSVSSSPAKARSIDGMVKRGEMIPRWDANPGFWKIFGNKLQVNGCQEGVCRLS